MQALAQLPHVAVKVSEFGLPEPGWDVKQNYRLVRDTLELFGHERCLFASNFPVASLRIGYTELVAHFEAFLTQDTPAQREAFFWRTAQRVYRIPLTIPSAITALTAIANLPFPQVIDACEELISAGVA
ncbi:putative TIM-barrel fold metal-dependent hydrolase [Pseudomonas psychrotolerans]|nr:putative TIM-barrel fold metal-dependent hydrolase [Pseudomonas psychrotolerans]